MQFVTTLMLAQTEWHATY